MHDIAKLVLFWLVIQLTRFVIASAGSTYENL